MPIEMPSIECSHETFISLSDPHALYVVSDEVDAFVHRAGRRVTRHDHPEQELFDDVRERAPRG